MKKVKGAHSIFRKVRGISDSTINEALANHQHVLQQLIGAYTEQQAQLKAVEEVVKGMLEGMITPPEDISGESPGHPVHESQP